MTNDKDYMREYMRRYRRKNPEKIKKARDAWAANNPDKVKAANHQQYLKRKARKEAARNGER